MQRHIKHNLLCSVVRKIIRKIPMPQELSAFEDTHTIHKVREFHKIFGHPVEDDVVVPSAKTRRLRYNLLLEEVLEFGRAIGVAYLTRMNQEGFDAYVADCKAMAHVPEDAPCDLIEAADALGDIDYVCQGANLAFGFPAEAVVAEIHSSNMSKLGEDGKPILAPDGKVVKGLNYRKPDIARVLQEHSHD